MGKEILCNNNTYATPIIEHFIVRKAQDTDGRIKENWKSKTKLNARERDRYVYEGQRSRECN